MTGAATADGARSRGEALGELLGDLDQRVEAMAAACTRCTRCVTVCPMPGPAGIEAEPESVIQGVLDLLRTGRGTPAAERWAEVCSGTGHCIEACGEGVNPRFLLAMGRRIIAQIGADDYSPGVYEQIKGACAGNRLYKRAPKSETYREWSEDWGINDIGWAYAPAIADLDNDGLLDLYATTGFLSFERGKPDG